MDQFHNFPPITKCEQRALKDRAIMHICLWDWICSAESRQDGYTLATLKVGCTLMDALELMRELPGNYVYVQSSSNVCPGQPVREVYGLICTDRPKNLPDWDSCFFVGVYREGDVDYKAVTSLYYLTDFMPDGDYRLGAIMMAGVGNTEEVSIESFTNALEQYRREFQKKQGNPFYGKSS